MPFGGHVSPEGSSGPPSPCPSKTRAPSLCPIGTPPTGLPLSLARGLQGRDRSTVGCGLQDSVGVGEASALPGPPLVERSKAPRRASEDRCPAAQASPRAPPPGGPRPGYATDLWTLKRVAEVIAKERGEECTESGVWHILHDLGFCAQVPVSGPWHGTRRTFATGRGSSSPESRGRPDAPGLPSGSWTRAWFHRSPMCDLPGGWTEVARRSGSVRGIA